MERSVWITPNFYTRDDWNVTIKKRAWRVFDYTNHEQELRGYQDNSKVKLYPMVIEFNKTCIKDKDLPVLTIFRSLQCRLLNN